MGTETSEINDLDAELSRLRRRAARLRPKVSTAPAAWPKWSDTMDEITGATEKMVASPARHIADLSLQFRAILWLIEASESVLDKGDARRLRRFGRNLDRLV